MVKGYKILDKIPAYDFSDSIGMRSTKEQQEDYIQHTTWGTKHEVKAMLEDMIKTGKNKRTLFALKTILKNYHLLRKVRIVNDGSWRNMKIMADHLFIEWEGAIGKELEYEEWSKIYNSITKEDILKVLNNIEQIFLQPSRSRRWEY